MSSFARGDSVKVTLPAKAVALLEEVHQKQKPMTPENATAFAEIIMAMPLFIRQCGGEELRLRRPERTAEVVPIIAPVMILEPAVLLQQTG